MSYTKPLKNVKCSVLLYKFMSWIYLYFIVLIITIIYYLYGHGWLDIKIISMGIFKNIDLMLLHILINYMFYLLLFYIMILFYLHLSSSRVPKYYLKVDQSHLATIFCALHKYNIIYMVILNLTTY